MRTPSQTVGPFFAIGLCRTAQNELAGGRTSIAGTVLDGGGVPVDDALIELWSPGAGFGRCATDAAGRFSFLVPDGVPQFELMVFARGLLKPALTRIYLGEGAAAEDETLVAQPDGDGYRFDIHLQGERATAFFELE